MPSTRNQQIADLVRTARLAKGWTQGELAERLGVNPQTVGHIERALHKPRPSLMEQLEDVLDTDLSAEAQVGHALLDEIVDKLAAKMRDLGPGDGIRIAADILEAVETWTPRRGGGGGVSDGGGGAPDTPSGGLSVVDGGGSRDGRR